MRLRRISFFAGWVAVALLAAAGFAAFRTPSGIVETGDVNQAAATLGHSAGSYAGLAFALSHSAAIDSASQGEVEEAEVASTPEKSTGTIADAESGWLSEVQVRELATRFFTEEDVNRAVRIAWCESRFNPESINLRTGAIGLFQHLPRYWPDRAAAAGYENADPRDPIASTAAAAWAVYHGGGWDIFACR